MHTINLILISACAGMMALSSFAAREITPPKNSQMMVETEKLLRMAKPELEQQAESFSLEQKAALKKIAFNSESDLQIRWRALVLAARLLKDDVRPEILQASKSSDWFMRSAAMMAANEISVEEAALLARKLINDKALVVRSAAVDILGVTGVISDRNILWKIIRDPINSRNGQSLWIRSQALQLLAKQPQKKEVSEFVSLLKESDLELQAIAIHGLELISDVKFGTPQDSIEEHRQKWMQWWEMERKTRSL